MGSGCKAFSLQKESFRGTIRHAGRAWSKLKRKPGTPAGSGIKPARFVVFRRVIGQD
jgi:hypothetical protein